MNDLPEPSANEQAEYGLAWDDATLESGHWFLLPAVAPTDAALLLCQYNPNETTYDEAARCTNSETVPRELVQLKQRFEALNTVEPGERSLHDWLEYARSKNIKHHSWIDKYANARPAPAQTPAPVVAASDGHAPPNKIVHSTKTRRNTLKPVIEHAQQQCTDKQDTAAVWAALLVLAEKKVAPLIGATEDGLQYLKNGTAASFNREALRKRLGR